VPSARVLSLSLNLNHDHNSKGHLYKLGLDRCGWCDRPRRFAWGHINIGDGDTSSQADEVERRPTPFSRPAFVFCASCCIKTVMGTGFMEGGKWETVGLIGMSDGKSVPGVYGLANGFRVPTSLLPSVPPSSVK